MCEDQDFSVFETWCFDDCPFKITLIFPFQSISSIFVTKWQGGRGSNSRMDTPSSGKMR